ncbi:MAG: DNA polymerase III subunit beta [Gemmataceae bacterium]
MRVICPREVLLEASQLVGVATAVREIKPILRNLKAIADGSRFTLMATDLEIGIRHELRSLTVQENGEAILPAAKLVSILRESTDTELVIEADENKVLVRGNVNEFEMPSENPADFPDIPTFSDKQYHEVPAGALRHMIHRTIFAAAKESGKFAITGVLWEVEAKHLRLVATDTKRLAQIVGPVSNHDAGETKGQSHLVPTKAMQLLERHLQSLGEEELVRVSLRPNEVLFQTDTTTIYSRLVEGRYPPYREIFPKKIVAKVPLQVPSFLTAVRQAAIMIDEEAKRVAFHFAPGLLTLEAQGPTTGRSKVPLAIEYDGPAIDINFDPQYVVEMLRVLEESDPLVLELVDGSRPALFKCGSDYSYLVMPIS